MPLTLTITSYQRLSPGQDPSKTVESSEFSIGRAPENDWVLPDPEMVLSKKHCLIQPQDGDYYLVDTSTNGVYLNQSEQRLGRGNSAKLNDGDEITLGDYEIRVNLSGAAAIDESFIDDHTDIFGTSGSPLIPPASSSAEDSLVADLLGDEGEADRTSAGPPPPATGSGADIKPNAANDPLGLEDSGPRLYEQASEPDHLPSDREFFQPPKARLDSDPAPPKPAKQPPAPPADEREAAANLIPDDWDEISLIQKSVSLDEAAAPPPPSPPEPPPPPTRAPQEKQEAFFDDREAPEPPPKPRPPAAVQTAPAEPPPPQATEQIPAMDLPQRPPSKSLSGTPNNDLFLTFLQGAGLNQELADTDPAKLMYTLGEVFRQTMQGMMELLRARDSLRNEFRLDRTIVGAAENNPLKHLPTYEEAAQAILARHKPSSGWMSANAAIRQGFDDIKAHEIATLTGMEAALSHLLKSFDPKHLEQQLGQTSMLSNILGGSRKARYWDAFTALYDKIAQEAEDDFQNFFRKAFAQAYDKKQREFKENRKR